MRTQDLSDHRDGCLGVVSRHKGWLFFKLRGSTKVAIADLFADRELISAGQVRLTHPNACQPQCGQRSTVAAVLVLLAPPRFPSYRKVGRMLFVVKMIGGDQVFDDRFLSVADVEQSVANEIAQHRFQPTTIARLRPSPVRSRIRSRSKEAKAASIVESRRPCEVVVSNSGSPNDLNAAPARSDAAG